MIQRKAVIRESLQCFWLSQSSVRDIAVPCVKSVEPAGPADHAPRASLSADLGLYADVFVRFPKTFGTTTVCPYPAVRSFSGAQTCRCLGAAARPGAYSFFACMKPQRARTWLALYSSQDLSYLCGTSGQLGMQLLV